MRLKSVLALCRVSNLPTVWMNVITASVLTHYATQSPVDWLITLAMAVAISCFYCAGMSLNDVCDYQWDKQHQTYRPIVTGKITLLQAKMITVLLFIIGFGLMAIAPNRLGLTAALVLFADIFGYNYFHKHHTGSVILMGAARALVFVVVGLGLVGTLSPWVILAASLQLCYTLSLTLVARHENKRGKPYSGPVIPRMIAGMAILDGLVLAVAVSPIWIALGAVLAFCTRLGQRFVRGD